MDLELVRTFLAIVDTGSFVAAAQRLHLTQAAVSRRVQALEVRLGCALFVRNRGGAVATRSGHAFQRHALSLMRTYEQARHELASVGTFRTTLRVGARFGLWEQLLVTWLGEMRASDPQLSVRGRIGFEDDLMQQLVEGSLDIGVMYTPQSRPGLEVEKLMDEELMLVATPGSSGDPQDPDGGYVYVDWGPEFHARHMLAFPDFAGAGFVAAIGWLGLAHVRAHGGSGYFPRRLVAGELGQGALQAVPGAPVVTMPAYAVYPAAAGLESLAPAMSLLRDVAGRVAAR